MSDKSSSDNANFGAEKNEKIPNSGDGGDKYHVDYDKSEKLPASGADVGTDALAETGGRRRSSVALNVVENPLQVRAVHQWRL